MRRLLLAALLSAAPLALVPAQAHITAAAMGTPVPKDQLMKPPADAEHYVVVSDAGRHGDMWRWTQSDGTRAYRHSQSLRGWITETDQITSLAPSGLPQKVEVRGITPNGDVFMETYDISANEAPAFDRSRRAQLLVLALGARTLPQLESLLPSRPPGAADCPECKGAGRFNVGDHRLICSVCCSLGWVEPVERAGGRGMDSA